MRVLTGLKWKWERGIRVKRSTWVSFFLSLPIYIYKERDFGFVVSDIHALCNLSPSPSQHCSYWFLWLPSSHLPFSLSTQILRQSIIVFRNILHFPVTRHWFAPIQHPEDRTKHQCTPQSSWFKCVVSAFFWCLAGCLPGSRSRRHFWMLEHFQLIILTMTAHVTANGEGVATEKAD